MEIIVNDIYKNYSGEEKRRILAKCILSIIKQYDKA